MDFVLDFFIASAHAQDAAAPQGGLMGFLPIIAIFVIFYFLLIRPQMKRAKEHRNMVSALNKGDEVVTNGGLLGRITDLDHRPAGLHCDRVGRADRVLERLRTVLERQRPDGDGLDLPVPLGGLGEGGAGEDAGDHGRGRDGEFRIGHG